MAMFAMLFLLLWHSVHSARRRLPTSSDIVEARKVKRKKPPPSFPGESLPYFPVGGVAEADRDELPVELNETAMREFDEIATRVIKEEREKYHVRRVRELQKQFPATEHVHTLKKGALTWILTDDQIFSAGARQALRTEVAPASLAASPTQRITDLDAFDAPDLGLSVKYRKGLGIRKFAILPFNDVNKWNAYYTIKLGTEGYGTGLKEWFIYPGYCKSRVIFRSCNSNAKKQPEPILYMTCLRKQIFETEYGGYDFFSTRQVMRPDFKSPVTCMVHRKSSDARYEHSEDDIDEEIPFTVEFDKGSIIVKSSPDEDVGLTNMIMLVAQALLPEVGSR